MKKRAGLVIALMLFVVLFFCPRYLAAQTDARSFILIEYLKVLPGKKSSFLKLEKELCKPLEAERKKQNRSTGWRLYEMMFPSGSSGEYDYVVYYNLANWNAIENIKEGTMDIAKKVLTADQQQMLNNSEQVFEVVKREVWQVEDGVNRPKPGPPAKYHLYNYMFVEDGKWEEYLEMERTLIKPIHEEQTKIGGRAGWTLISIKEPGGSKMPYHAATMDFFDRWADIGNNDQSAFYSQIHPGKSPEYITRQITSTRSLIRQEIRVLVDYVD